jgi:hypothetical protein
VENAQNGPAFSNRTITDAIIDLTVAMRLFCPPSYPSPKKSSVPRIAMTASFPCSETTETLTLPCWT